MDSLFTFTVTHDRTGETIHFKGQGTSLTDAFKDGYKLMGDTFRPKNDGKQRDPILCNVRKADGTLAMKPLKEWEAGVLPVAEIIEIEE